jgi:hypothetical protein
VVRKLREWRTARKERKLGRHVDSRELEQLRDQQSPFRAKWGFFPK